MGVRYDFPLHAQRAVQMSDQSYVNGATISVDFDYNSQVGGVPSGTGWQDLLDHFASVGKVELANLKPVKSPSSSSASDSFSHHFFCCCCSRLLFFHALFGCRVVDQCEELLMLVHFPSK